MSHEGRVPPVRDAHGTAGAESCLAPKSPGPTPRTALAWMFRPVVGMGQDEVGQVGHGRLAFSQGFRAGVPPSMCSTTMGHERNQKPRSQTWMTCSASTG